VRNEVKSPIAGSVWSHVSSVDQHVEAGSVLLVCECMKTEIPIESPVAGTVAWLRPCGENVEADDVVAVVEIA
jgi:acetyl-CoA carboxylase biotin carboxyl carrier protein